MRADSTIHGPPSSRTGHVTQGGTSPPQRHVDPGDERRSCRANERKTKRKKRSRLSGGGTRDSYRCNPSSQFLSSLSLVVIYVKIFHGTAALSALHRAENFRARCRSSSTLPLRSIRPPLVLSPPSSFSSTSKSAEARAVVE